MNIFYVNCKGYDYLTATLVEGLTGLGHNLICSRESNYGKTVPTSRLRAVAEAADLIVVGSNNGVEYDLLETVANPKIVAVDGTDTARFEVPGIIQIKAVFKRELCKEDKFAEADFIYPMPFAAEKRYFVPDIERDLAVSFAASMGTNPIRHSIHMRLLNRNHPAIFSGTTGERAYSTRAVSSNAIATPEYHSLLARSRISISAPGAGYDCARYWEIPAAGAMLFTYAPDIIIPDGFTDGVNCATFSSLDEFEEKLDFYLRNPDRVEEIARAGYKHTVACHTTERRAAYFLDLAIPAASRDGFCERFFTGYRRQTPLTRVRKNIKLKRAKDRMVTWLRRRI